MEIYNDILSAIKLEIYSNNKATACTIIDPKLLLSVLTKIQIQTAYDLLMQFKFDIPKINSFLLPLTTAGGLLCGIGYKEANLLLTRLCVRALLPVKYSGLD
jgi:hypothetical protein